jgi:hypothetical protein
VYVDDKMKIIEKLKIAITIKEKENVENYKKSLGHHWK